MAKKKKLGLEDLGGFVFSTNDNFELDNDDSNETLAPNEQRLLLWLKVLKDRMKT